VCPCGARYELKKQWAFFASCWDQLNFRYVHLKEIHRQDDANFVSLLQNIRKGLPMTKKERQLLLREKDDPPNATTIVPCRW
jgi:hypothetical protein